MRKSGGWGKGLPNEMNMYKMGFKIPSCIQPCMLMERLSLCQHQDIIRRHLNDAQNSGGSHI